MAAVTNLAIIVLPNVCVCYMFAVMTSLSASACQLVRKQKGLVYLYSALDMPFWDQKHKSDVQQRKLI